MPHLCQAQRSGHAQSALYNFIITLNCHNATISIHSGYLDSKKKSVNNSLFCKSLINFTELFKINTPFIHVILNLCIQNINYFHSKLTLSSLGECYGWFVWFVVSGDTNTNIQGVVDEKIGGKLIWMIDYYEKRKDAFDSFHDRVHQTIESSYHCKDSNNKHIEDDNDDTAVDAVIEASNLF